MAADIIETSSGAGTLFSGGESLGRVPYTLTVTLETAEVRELGGSARRRVELRSAGGRLVLQGALLQLDSNALLLKDLLLVLQDGRRARIIIESAEMRTGNCRFAVKGEIE